MKHENKIIIKDRDRDTRVRVRVTSKQNINQGYG